MRWSTVLEGINVRLDGVDWDVVLLGPLGQQLGIMDALGSRHNLLTSHEEIIRVAPPSIIRIRHRVERAHFQWKLVQHVEISVILLSDQVAQDLLAFSIEIIFDRQMQSMTMLMQQVDAFLKSQDQWLFFKVQKIFEWKLLSNCFQLSRTMLGNPRKNGMEQPTKKFQHFMIMLLDRHLNIKTGELGQMTKRIGIFCTKHWSHLIDTREIRRHAHLLVQLRTLCQKCRPVKVL